MVDDACSSEEGVCCTTFLEGCQMSGFDTRTVDGGFVRDEVCQRLSGSHSLSPYNPCR